MFFLPLSRINVWFAEREFVGRTYMAAKTLPTTRRVEIINKKEFAVAAINADDKTFVVHIAALVEPTTMLIYSSCQAQVVLLMSKEIGIPAEYSDFFNVFSSDSAAELPKYIGINDHPINPLNNKQLLYSLICSLGLVELETLKIYIKANLASGFIRPFKYPIGTLILFIQKKIVASIYT